MPAQKAQVVQKLRHEFSLDLLLTIAQPPRATFYYHLERMRVPDKYREAKSEIVAIYYENKERYGYRRITAELHNREFSINHKTVQRLMKELGLVCRVRIKKYRSYKGEVWKIAPNLLNRNFYAEKPNQKWVTDVTEFSLFGQKKEICQSMSRKSNCLDNAVMENFFGLLKSDLLYLQKFDSLEHFKQELADYLDYYNNHRIKIKLKGLPSALHRQQALSVA